MSRRICVWAAAAALLATGPACRMCHRDECSARRDSAPPGCNALPTSHKRSAGGLSGGLMGYSGGVPNFPTSAGQVEGLMSGDSFPAYPTSFGGPSYPVGDPVPLRPTATGPANELPYPGIPNPGVPETPAAATPGLVSPPSARTTGDQRYSR